jgi:hypothetical protein
MGQHTVFEEAIHDPSLFFGNPCAVLDDARFDREQKIKILKQWEYDVRELMVAEEEGMTPRAEVLAQHQTTLDEILRCLHQLGAGVDVENAQTSKTGGL